MSVYLEDVWLLNTLLDYLLLVSSAQFCGRRIRRLRLVLVAALGGGYAVAVLLWPPLGGLLLRLCAGVLLGWLAFAGENKCGRTVAAFILLSAALAGVTLALGFGGVSWHILILSSGVFYLLLEVVFRQAARFGREDIKAVRIIVGERQCTLRALRDTGNTLRSPVNGAPVLVAETEALRSLWSAEETAILRSQQPVQEKVAQMYELGCSRFSLLPYTAVGGSGLLLCMRSDAVIVGKRRYRHAPVALVDHTMGVNYDALWGGEADEVAPLHTCVDTSQAG